MGDNGKNKKRRSGIWSFIFIAVLFAITAVYIIKEFDLKALYEDVVSSEHMEWLIAAPILTVVFFLCFAAFMKITAKALEFKLPLYKAITYAFLDFFYTSATPAGCGVPAATAYAMTQDGYSGSLSSAALLMQTICYRFSQLIFGVGAGIMVFTGAFEVEGFFKTLFIIGACLSIIVTAFFCAMLFFTRLTRKGGLLLIKLGAKLHIVKDFDATKQKFINSLVEYRTAAELLRSDKKLIVKQMGVTLLQRAAFFSISYMVYLSFGLHERSFFYVFFLQVAVALAVDNLPLPGGIGVNEYAFYLLYERLYPETDTAAAAMILTRAFCYYIPLVFTAFAALSREIILNVKAKRSAKK